MSLMLGLIIVFGICPFILAVFWYMGVPYSRQADDAPTAQQPGKQLHSERNEGNPKARFKEVERACEVHADPEKRADYDQRLALRTVDDGAVLMTVGHSVDGFCQVPEPSTLVEPA